MLAMGVPEASGNPEFFWPRPQTLSRSYSLKTRTKPSGNPSTKLQGQPPKKYGGALKVKIGYSGLLHILIDGL